MPRIIERDTACVGKAGHAHPQADFEIGLCRRTDLSVQIRCSCGVDGNVDGWVLAELDLRFVAGNDILHLIVTAADPAFACVSTSLDIFFWQSSELFAGEPQGESRPKRSRVEQGPEGLSINRNLNIETSVIVVERQGDAFIAG